MNEAGNAPGNVPGNAALPSGIRKPANQEIGGPGGWHSRGYLPHFDGHEVTQHVTFHLADSLPTEARERVEEEIRTLPREKQDAERRKRVETWIDSGQGSCVLREPAIAALVQSSLLHFDGLRYRLLAWVVMPNHAHVLFQPLYDWTVAKIVASWKKFTAREICEFRKAGTGDAPANIPGNTPGNAALASGIRKTANQEIGGPRKSAPVWHREYWDRFIRSDRHFQQAVEYIHGNPVKAGLVGRPEDWPWSSACMAKRCPDREMPR